MDRIVVVGGGGHAKVLVCLLEKLRYEIVGYTDQRDRGALLGVGYIGNDDVLNELATTDANCLVAIGLGKVDTSPMRVQMMARTSALGFDAPLIVSPHAVVNQGVALGLGTMVGDGAVVNPGTEAGRLCILNTNCTVEHDCLLGDNVHIAPGSTVSGGVEIGANCMIGAGSTVLQGVTIVAGSLVGAGSTIVRDITAPGTYVGNPARRIK